jgi:hypothetical protein
MISHRRLTGVIVTEMAEVQTDLLILWDGVAESKQNLIRA